MTNNNIEKTISCDETNNDAQILERKHTLVYFKLLLDKKIEFPYCRNDLIEHNDNGR